MRLGLNAKKHRRNLNVLVVGGSGAGKTRFYAKPNIMQCNTSFIIADPKGELVRATAPLLIEEGYDVKVFNLINPENSDGYNPFAYVRSDEQVMTLDEVRNLHNSNALVFLRGERPIVDKKYDILRHPNIRKTEDGGAKPYRHSKDEGYLRQDLSFELSDDLSNLEILDESEE